MKVSDLRLQQIAVGMRIKSLTSDREATVVSIDHKDDEYAMIQWDGESQPYSGFWGTDCDCEVTYMPPPERKYAMERCVFVREPDPPATLVEAVDAAIEQSRSDWPHPVTRVVDVDTGEVLWDSSWIWCKAEVDGASV